MLHSDLQAKGLGRQIYQAFEGYIRSLHSKSIRIDVVTNYSGSVLRFWENQGYEKLKEIELNWNGNHLPAAVMKKTLL